MMENALQMGNQAALLLYICQHRTDPTAPLEIIYWFHDAGGFKNSHEEWNKLWYSLREMTKKKIHFRWSAPQFCFCCSRNVMVSQGASNILGSTSKPNNRQPWAAQIVLRRLAIVIANGHAWQYNGGTAGYKVYQPMDAPFQLLIKNTKAVLYLCHQQ